MEGFSGGGWHSKACLRLNDSIVSNMQINSNGLNDKGSVFSHRLQVLGFRIIPGEFN